MSDFRFIEKKLDKWFSKSFHELPSALKRLVIAEFRLFTWDNLSPEQRRSYANQLDYQHDPATENHQAYWFNFHAELQELEKQLQQWEQTSTPTALDLQQKEQRIAQIKEEIAHRDRLEKLLMKRDFPRYIKTDPENIILKNPEKLIGMPLALNSLKNRLGATQEELAAWIFMTELEGGLRTYKPQNHPEEFQRFYFEPEMNRDYLTLIFNCWFDESEIEHFEPKERFISGKIFLKILKDSDQNDPELFITEMIKAGRINELHPITGATRASLPDDPSLPAIDTGLFSIDEIEKILVEYGMTSTPLQPQRTPKKDETPEERKERLLSWHQEELAKKASGALKRTAEREGIKRQTLSEILKR